MTVLPSYIDKPWKSWFLRKDHLLEVRIKGDRIHGLFSPILKNGLYIGVKTHLLGEMIHYDLLILGNICAFWEDDSTTQLYR